MRKSNNVMINFARVVAALCMLISAGASATIVDDLQPDTWLSIPNSKLQVLNPCPGDNCAYSGPNQGFFGIMDAWSGGAFDTIENRLIVWGGGHQSYYGNDVYAFDLDTLSWSQLMAPSNYEATLAHEDAGIYPDGRPVSRHTYNSLVFVESQNAFMSAGTYAMSPSGSSGDAKFWKLDFDSATLDWTRAQDGDSNGTMIVGWAAYNRVTDTVYYHRSGGGRLYKYDPSTDTHTFLAQKGLQIYGTPAVDTVRNKVLVIGGGSSAQAFVWDMNSSTPVHTNLLSVSAFTGSAGTELANASQIGLDYDSQNDQYVAWNGGRTVYYIDPDTFQVTKTSLPGDDPGAEASNGTYGRFRYSPAMGGFVVVNATNRDVHVFKTSGSGVTPGPIVSFSADDASIDSGGSVTLTWSAANASNCVASGDWNGSLATSGSQTISNISADQNFLITCSGDGGDTTQSVNVTVNDTPAPPDPNPNPDPDPDADSSWAARSSAPGVLSAMRFDSAADVSNWKQLDGSQGNVKWETGNKTSGNGSLRIDVLKTDGANSGSWRRWLSDDQREFVEGDEFYVSYRQYFPDYFSSHAFNGGGWKQSIISRNAGEMNGVPQDCNTNECGSNQVNEMVLVNYQYRGLIQGYNRNTAGAYPGWFVGSSNACSGSDFVYQNAVDRGPQNIGTACENARARLGGLYSYGGNTGDPDPLTGAFIYGKDRWVTFKIWVKLGSQGTSTSNSAVKVWAAAEGEDWDLLIDRDNLDLGGGPAHNTLWLLPYDTGKTANPNREDTYTLYDEVIVSLNDIAAPDGETPAPPPPDPEPDPEPAPAPQITFASSSDSVIEGESVTLTWEATNANSCVASGDWSGSVGVSGEQTIGGLQQNSTFTLTCLGEGGGVTDSVDVMVQEPAPPPAAPELDFSASSTAIIPGTTITLNWEATNANSCEASGDWSGSVGVSGQQAIVGLVEDAAYTLTCSGDGGTVTGLVRVDVEVPVQAPTIILSVYPITLSPQVGGTVILTWSTEFASSCVASDSWTGARSIAGLSIVGPIDGSETYTLTCSNDAGSETDSLTVSYEDSDSDGMPDIWETAFFGSLANNGTTDSDSDGLIDQLEYVNGTDPGRDDTDSDGQTDGVEVSGGSDPRDPNSMAILDGSPNQPQVADERKAELGSFELETVSGYVDPDGNPLSYAQWQIALDEDFTSLVFDRDVTGSTSMMVPMGVLEPGATYYLRTRHFDSSNMPSDWSDPATLIADTEFPNDADNNGINDTYQVAGNPDSNNNGIADPVEGICNLYDAEGGNIIGLTSDVGDVRCYTSVPNSAVSNPDLDADSEVPVGMFSFRVENLPMDPDYPARVELSVFLPEDYDQDSGWQKYDEATGEFSDYSANVVFSGNTAIVSLVDGGAGDQDGTVNGIIVDPSGPVVTPTASTPPPETPPTTPPPTTNPPVTNPPVTPPSNSPGGDSGGGGGGTLGLYGLAALLAMARRRRMLGARRHHSG